MGLAERLAARLIEDRRQIVLKSLAEVSDYRLSDDTVKTVLRHFGHTVSSDTVRQIMLWLEQQALLRIDRLHDDDRELWVAELTRSGLDVARGCAHVGITRPEPR